MYTHAFTTPKGLFVLAKNIYPLKDGWQGEVRIYFPQGFYKHYRVYNKNRKVVDSELSAFVRREVSFI